MITRLPKASSPHRVVSNGLALRSKMTTCRTYLGVLVLSPCIAGASLTSAQILHPKEPLPSFEVATIKPWKPTLRPLNELPPAKVDPVQHVRAQTTDRVQFIGQIALLIMDAYNLPIGSERRILQAPGWVYSEADRYEVQAKIDAARFAAIRNMTPPQQHQQVALLEQSLLAERCHLKLHFETRGQAPTFALVVAKGGMKFTPALAGEHSSLVLLGNQLTAHAVTLDQFAASPLWTPIGNRYVVNQSGLTDAFDFTLKWASDTLSDAGAAQPHEDLPPLFDAIREQLGLNVIDTKVPLEVIVVDHIERPSKN